MKKMYIGLLGIGLVMLVVLASVCASSGDNNCITSQNTTNGLYKDDPTVGTNVQVSEKVSQSTSNEYIGNSNTKKFHHTECHYESKIKSNHKVYFHTKESAIRAGYKPCKKCRP